jgi:hypothetical protein
MNTEIEAVLREMRERKVNGNNTSPPLHAWANRIEGALRRPLADAEAGARELLAAEYERDGRTSDADLTRAGLPIGETDIRALRAIVAALSQQPEPKAEARGGVDGWALTKLRAHETRCENCGRAVWDRKDPNNCIGFIAPCGKRVARLEDCGTADCAAALTESRNGR